MILYILFARDWVLAVAGNDNIAAPIGHGLNPTPGVDLALDLVPGAIVVFLGLQSVVARKVDHVFGREPILRPLNVVIDVRRAHGHA